MTLLKGWMNTVMVCPNGCGKSVGYTAPDIALWETCLFCGIEMEGFRILEKTAH
jgi:hypothetical protein